jgi:hypothetical protein
MRTWFAAALLALAIGRDAEAQAPRPIPLFVFDLRGFYSALSQDPTTAESLAVLPIDLPHRGLGGVAGVHVYPFRRGGLAFGLGGEALLARGRSQRIDDAGAPLGSPITQRLRSLTGSLSLNFGHREGWSYLSAGIGPLAFPTFLGEETPSVEAPAKSTISMGGGARWFINNHIAFCFDVRFHQTRPEIALAPYPARQRSRLLIMSAGIALK